MRAATSVAFEDREPREHRLEQIVMRAAQLFEAPAAALFVAQDAGLRSRCGFALPEVDASELQAMAERLWRVKGRDHYQCVADVREDWRFTGPPGQLLSCVASPVSGSGRTTGILLAARAQPYTPLPAQAQQLNELARQAGLELESERETERLEVQEQLLEKTLELAKYGEDLRQLHRLSTTHYESLDQLLADYLEAGRAIFGMTSGAVTQLRGRYAGLRAALAGEPAPSGGMVFETDRDFSGVVVKEQRTVLCESVSADPLFDGRKYYTSWGPSSYIGAPILVDGEPFGVLSFASPHQRRIPYTSHEAEVIELMAKGIGRSIQEERMREARRRSEVSDRDRGRILEMVAKDQPLDAILEQIALLVERQAPDLTASISLERNGTLSCVAAPSMPRDFRPKMQEAAIVYVEGCCLSAAARRQTEIFQTASPKCGPEGKRSGLHEYCWLAGGASPILSGAGELLGLLVVYTRLAIEPRRLDRELIERAAQLAAIAIERRRLTDTLAYQARHDVLTGLPNRDALVRALDEWNTTAIPEHRMAAVFVDLDRFKQINDHLGHAAGDAVLRATAARLRAWLKEGEQCARIGGDEFVAVLRPVTDARQVRSRAQALLDSLRAPIDWDGRVLYVTASIGISLDPLNGRSETLLANADMAMYQVKRSGKNDLACFAPELERRHASRLEIEHALRQAPERGELELSFQPIRNIQESRQPLAGFEVLLTWQHPTLGRVPPSRFIPIAEECGMIASIGAWVLRDACRWAAAWSQGQEGVRISVNVSPKQFARPDVVDTVAAALAESGLPPCLLELELTESAIMENVAAARQKLERLREMGVRLSLDDFGTGYSSLSYLRWIPVQALKIAPSFVAEMNESSEARTLVKTILELARNIGLEVTAEGVENARQLELLRDLGCHKAQGHWIGGPLRPDKLEEWLRRETLQASVL